MGLTFRKRDDFDKMMDDLGVSTVDLVTDDDKKTVPSPEKKEDPFDKFLAPKETNNEKDPN
ncbi:MAG: SPJ_0845 family protein [Lactococcus cremoris]